MKNIKNFAPYFLVPLASVLVFFLLFDLWSADLRTPIFGYDYDGLFHLFIVKIIAQTGWFFQNDLVGFPHLDGSFYLHDFPIHADSFNFLVIRVFAFFSQDHFLLVNSFFIFTFALNSLAAFVALRAFKIEVLSAALVSILYAFLPYHFQRDVRHLFLSNYAVIPLIIMVALWISEGKIQLLEYNKKQQISLAPNNLFFIGFLVSVFAANSGVYYAFYGCVILFFAWLLRALRNGEFFNREILICPALCFVIFATLILLYLPPFKFWIENGLNPSVGNRDYISSELYALRIVDLLMPINNHYVGFLNNFRSFFERVIVIEIERRSSAIGTLASLGFLFLLIWPLIGNSDVKKSSIFDRVFKRLSLVKSDKDLISNLSRLNFLSLLFATAGGLVMFFAMFFPLIRSHARFSLFIAFFAFFVIAIIFDKLSKNNLVAKFAIIAISTLALFDQVGNLNNFHHSAKERVQSFNIDRDFVKNLEMSLKQNSQVFILPVFGFPEVKGDQYQSLILYLHSQNLRLSYPAMKGRATNLWQEKVVKMEFKDFILELKKEGFSAVVINRHHFANLEGNSWKDLDKLEKDFKSLKTKTVVSNDKNWIAFKL